MARGHQPHHHLRESSLNGGRHHPDILTSQNKKTHHKQQPHNIKHKHHSQSENILNNCQVFLPGQDGVIVCRNKSSFWLRSCLRYKFYQMGRSIHKHPGTILFVGILILVTLGVSLKSATIETDVENLWIEEDGRVEKELNYVRSFLGEGIGSTQQLLIQTPRDPNGNILHPESLLNHLEVIKAASEVTVDLYEVTWRLKDVCLTPSIPPFEQHHVESIFDNLFPCEIKSPLDCFWEGSKLLGPDNHITIPGFPTLGLKWTNLNPESLVATLKGVENLSSFPFEIFHEIMKRAGITSAYQEKPCLNPRDPECPSTAPNKGSGQGPDVGAELTGGCYGFATKYMHWPEDVIVGGVRKNRTGHIVKANALSSVIQLMGEQQMFNFWAQDFKVHSIDWSLEKAKTVLEVWQRKFTAEVSKLVGMKGDRPPVISKSRQYSYSVFTTTLLSDIMKNFSHANYVKIATGFLAISVFVTLSSLIRKDSCVFVSIAGVALIALTIVSSLGLCALIRLPLNAATTQITPFLTLGFGVYIMQLLINTYSIFLTTYHEDIVGRVLQDEGPIVGLISSCGVASFLSAYFIPIPALRAFILQFAIILTLLTGSFLVIFPAILSLDVKRRRSGRIDVLCCLREKVSSSLEDDEPPPSSSRSQTSSSVKNNVKFTHNDLNDSSSRCPVHSGLDKRKMDEPFLPFKKIECTCFRVEGPHPSDVDANEDVETQQTSRKEDDRQEDESRLLNSHSLMMRRKPFKLVILFVFFTLLMISLSGVTNVKDGLDFTDVVPRGTIEHKFLQVQQKYFSFYYMFAVTEGNFEYPVNQKLLYDYHSAFTRISKIIKNDDGGLPEFWLATFRDWLRTLQAAYDRDSSLSLITREGWETNASADGILAYKLLVQTGRNDYPVDKSQVNKVRLVDQEGIINPKAFYTYLTAWASNDALAYYASQANLKPDPREWFHDPTDREFKIPKSQPLVYAQIPFYLNRMNSTEEITSTVEEIRSICQKFEERGLPNFPTGHPFVYWEQYVRLPLYAGASALLAVAAVFGIIGLFLFNLWAASIIVTLLVLIVVQLYGLLGVFSISFSAVPAAILVVSVGLGTVFFIPIVISFLSNIGTKSQRTILTIRQMDVPVLHGSLGFLMGVSMLYWSEFDFIVKYFFFILAAFIILGMFYAFLVLPVLLTMLGPPAEVIPDIVSHSKKIHDSSPYDSPQIRRKAASNGGKKFRALPSQYFSRREHPRVQSDISLSTIHEESGIYQSREIVVQPEFVVETTTITSPSATPKVESPSATPACDSPINRFDAGSPASDTGSSGSSNMSRPNSAPAECIHTSFSQHQVPQTVTTKVTTTAKLKLELHGPFSYDRNGRPSSSSSSASTNSYKYFKDNRKSGNNR